MIVDGCAVEHQDVFAARATDVDGAEWAANDLFVQLGELARDHHDSVVAAHLAQIFERAEHPVGRFVDHRGAMFGGDLGEASCAVAALAGDEAFEHEPIGGEPADGERHDRGARAGGGADVVAGVDRCSHDALARIGDAGRAGVAHDCHVAAAGEHRHRVVDPGDLGVFVAHGEPVGAYAGVLEEETGTAGVLATDQPDVGEHVDRPRRQVAQVADRRGDEPERAHGGAPSRWSSESAGRSSTSSPTRRPHRPNAPPSASMTHVARHTGTPSRNRFMCMVFTTTPSSSR